MGPELLEIRPNELNFIFELKKQSVCLLQLLNKTDQFVAFKVKTTSPKKYCVRPNVGIVQPRSTCDFTVTMQAQRVAPPDMQCKDKFLIQSTIVPFGTTDVDITPTMFAKDNGTYIEERKLRVVLLSPPNSPVLLPNNGTQKQEPTYEAPVLKEQVVLSRAEDNLPPQTVVRDMEELKPAKNLPGELTPSKEVEDLREELKLTKDVVEEPKIPTDVEGEPKISTDGEELKVTKNLIEELKQGKDVQEDLKIAKDVQEDLKIAKDDQEDLKIAQDVQEDLKLAKDVGYLKTAEDVQDLKLAKDVGNFKTAKDVQDFKLAEDVEYLKFAKESEDSKPTEDARDLKLAKDVEDLKFTKKSEAVKPTKDIQELNLAKDVEKLKFAKRTENVQETKLAAVLQEPELTKDVDELKLAKDLANLQLAKDIEKLKTNLKELESQLSDAQNSIKTLREERGTFIEDKQALSQELAMLRTKTDVRKVQVGFPALFVCMVAMISLVLGYKLHY